MISGYNLEVKREQPGVSSEPYQIELGVEDQMKKKRLGIQSTLVFPNLQLFKKSKLCISLLAI